MRARACEVLVLGGGPAGSAAARLLATWGHDVILVDREPPRPSLAESIPPSVLPLLQVVGAAGAIEGADFVRATGNTVWWGGRDRQVEPFPCNRTGYQVLRSAFDELLRDEAVSAGVRLWRPATALGAVHAGEGQLTRIADADGEHEVASRWVVDATGRSGILARRQRQSVASELRTVALAAAWDRPDGWPLPDETHTLVESAEWGWGWSVPSSMTRRYMTVMLNPSSTPVDGQAGMTARYLELLMGLPALGALTDGAQRSGEVFACDATPYVAADPAGDSWLAVGDAASFIDPLSSFGIKKALASAWLGAVVAHTCLTKPGNASAALQLFRERERAYVDAAAAALRDLSSDAGHLAGFWGARQTLETEETPDHLVTRLRNDPEVLAAFTELRARPSSRFLRAPGVGVTMRGVVRGNLVVNEPHLELPGAEGPVRYLRNIDLLTLLEVAPQADDAGAMYTTYVGVAGPADLPDFLGALSVLVARGVLRIA